MKKLIIPVLLTSAVLSGCASGATGAESSPTPTPTPTPENTKACQAFGVLTMTIADKINNTPGPAKDMWESVRVSFDEVGLQAHGIVQQRILTLTSDWPDLFDVMTGQYDDINSKFEAVARACKAEGVTINYATFVTKK